MTRRYSRSWFVLIGTVLVFLALSACNAGKGEVVAEINGEAITKEELYQEMLKQGGKQLLDRMIDQKLIQQAAKEKGVTATEEQIRERMDEMKEQLGGDASFQMYLAQYGITEESLKQDVRHQLLIEGLLKPEIKVSEEEMKAYFEENKDMFGEPEKVKARHILVKSEAQAKEIRAKLDQGESFEELAKQYSTDEASKANGGDLGYFARGDMVPEFEEVAFSLKPGETSQPVKSQFGYHIIRVEDHQQPVPAKYEDKKEEIRQQILQQKIAEKMEPWLNELRNKAKVTNYLK